MAVLDGVCDERFEAVRRMTVCYMMNKMGPGIVGSERATEYGQAVFHAVTR